jgi:hypothetical protein
MISAALPSACLPAARRGSRHERRGACALHQRPHPAVLQSHAHDHVPIRLVPTLVHEARVAPIPLPETRPRFTVVDRPVILDILPAAAIPRTAPFPASCR